MPDLRRAKISEELGTKGPLSGAHFRTGLVAEQDVPGCRVRIRFPDRTDHNSQPLLSWWLPVLVRKSQDDKWYCLPDIGEQVVAYMDERDEDGCVLGAIYSAADAPPTTPAMTADKDHVTYKDGTWIEYDRASHVLDASFTDGTDIQYDATAHVLDAKFNDGAEIKYDAAAHALSVEIPGTIEVHATGDVSVRTDGSASIDAQASITLRAPIVQIDGLLEVTKKATFDAPVAVTGTVTATGAVVGTNIDALGNVTGKAAVDPD